MANIINRSNGDSNVGSLDKIFFVFIDELLNAEHIPIAVINKATGGTDPVPIESMIAAGTVWDEAEYSQDTPLWESSEEETAQGTMYKEKITWTVGKDYASRRSQFADMEGKQFAVWAGDNNARDSSNWKFFGYRSIDGQRHGMRFSKTKTTGKARNDLNHYILTFYMESFIPPWNAQSPY